MLYALVGFDVLLGGVHGRVVDGEHAGRRLRLDGAEDELAGAVGLLAQEKVEEGELVHVVRYLHLAALKCDMNSLNQSKAQLSRSMILVSMNSEYTTLSGF